MEKCLYVSDLDGTLLRSDETISDYTCSVINKLTQSGMLFSYATARSYVTAKKVTKGLDAKIPLIVYNGAFVIDNVSEEVLISNFFQNDIKIVLEELFSNEIYPIVYSYIDEVELFSFIPEKCTKGMRDFLHTREGDKRWREAENCEQLMQGNLFYITCIDEKEKLEPFFEKYKDKYHVVFQKDIYTREQWLEIMPKEASKANAILQLKKLLGCEKVISFGDASNDMDMFHISDEAYAVANANEELKQNATGVIECNNEDGVAKWLERKNFTEEKQMIDTRCGLQCEGCEYKESCNCGGCIATNGNPFHGECPVAQCCQEKGYVHCGECPDIPCKLLSDYSCDKEHGDTPPGARIEQCLKWAGKK